MRPAAVRGLSDLAAQVLADQPRLGPTRLVLIDGPSGSGKSTLADRLVAALEATGRHPTAILIHLDDLYEGWSGLDGDRGHGSLTRRLQDQLISPLAAGRRGTWQRFDWHARSFAEWHDVFPPGVLLLEGCGAIDPGFDAQATVRIWVEAPRALRTARGIERDGELMRTHWQAWQAKEDALFSRRRSRERADLLVDGDPRVPHDPDREVVLLDQDNDDEGGGRPGPGPIGQP